MILLKIMAEMKSNEYIQDITDDEYVTTLLERESFYGIGQNELYAFCGARKWISSCLMVILEVFGKCYVFQRKFAKHLFFVKHIYDGTLVN